MVQTVDPGRPVMMAAAALLPRSHCRVKQTWFAMLEVGWDVSELANLRRKSLSLWGGKGGSHKRCCQGTRNSVALQ